VRAFLKPFSSASSRASRPFVLGAASTALAASAVFAIPSFGGPGADTARIASRHHTFAGGAAVGRSSRRGIGGVKNVLYRGTVDPGKEDGITFKCPRKTPHAVSGYFLPDTPEQLGKIQLADSFPSGKGNRNWDIGVFNPSPDPQVYYVGAVCIK
jgi:hypothetical protein